MFDEEASQGVCVYRNLDQLLVITEVIHSGKNFVVFVVSITGKYVCCVLDTCRKKTRDLDYGFNESE